MDPVEALFRDGIFIIKSFCAKDKIKDIKDSCFEVQKKYESIGGRKNFNGVHVEHPFIYSELFMPLIADERVCSLVESAIGDRLALVSCSLLNRQIAGDENDIPQVGTTWHTDSRYIQRGNVKLPHGFGYIAILCIDDFTDKNGSTLYVPRSHKFTSRPPRSISPDDYEITCLNAESGDLVIIDSGLWHSAGVPTSISRWGLFTTYGPWYFKPYFDYVNMFAIGDVLGMSSRVMDLLHFTSTPPASQLERINTLETADEVKTKLKKMFDSGLV